MRPQVPVGLQQSPALTGTAAVLYQVLHHQHANTFSILLALSMVEIDIYFHHGRH
jgi:hypothetical protein